MKSNVFPSDIAESLLIQGHSILQDANTLKIMLMSSDEATHPQTEASLTKLRHMCDDIESIIDAAIQVRRNVKVVEPKRNWIQDFVGRF